MKKKLKYPEYINGVKQVQNPIHRLFIRIWYSNWFRFGFLLFPWWLFALIIFITIKFELQYDGQLAAIVCMIPFYLGLIFNDYSNLRRIGLDEYHRPLKEADNEGI